MCSVHHTGLDSELLYYIRLLVSKERSTSADLHSSHIFCFGSFDSDSLAVPVQAEYLIAEQVSTVVEK